MNRARTILVSVDYSCCSDDALTQAAHIAGSNSAALHALYVVDVPANLPQSLS